MNGLMLAAEAGSIEIMQIFLDAGLSIDLQDKVFEINFIFSSTFKKKNILIQGWLDCIDICCYGKSFRCCSILVIERSRYLQD